MSVQKEKRKNEDHRPLPWWLLAVGFVLGVALTLVAVGLTNRPASSTADNSPGVALTATTIIQQASATAQALGFGADVATPAPDTDLDPIAATATYVVQQATEMAVLTATAPGS